MSHTRPLQFVGQQKRLHAFSSEFLLSRKKLKWNLLAAVQERKQETEEEEEEGERIQHGERSDRRQEDVESESGKGADGDGKRRRLGKQ